MIEAILRGESLTLHKIQRIDPIGSIMAKAQSLKGKFGGQIKHFVFRSRILDTLVVQAAQTLTEMLQQKVLSVKTIETDLPKFDEYMKTVKRWFDVNPKIEAKFLASQMTCRKMAWVRCWENWTAVLD